MGIITLYASYKCRKRPFCAHSCPSSDEAGRVPDDNCLHIHHNEARERRIRRGAWHSDSWRGSDGVGSCHIGIRLLRLVSAAQTVSRWDFVSAAHGRLRPMVPQLVGGEAASHWRQWTAPVPGFLAGVVSWIAVMDRRGGTQPHTPR